MNSPHSNLFRLALLLSTVLPRWLAAADAIPDPLKTWEQWAVWGEEHRACPTPYSDPKKHLCFWPSQLALQVARTGATFELGVTVFHETWVPLPGGPEAWPLGVKANDQPLAVVEHDGHPALRLAAGTYRLAGSYRWNDFPQRLALPREIGIVALSIDGQPVESPAWDAQGFLWLKRDGSSEEADKNFLTVKVSAALEDGIPLWLRTEIELTVSGKSREEDLGHILPEGWKLAAVQSAIPVAVDETGRMKAQVRAGKWTVQADAFRFDNPQELRYAAGAKAAVVEELVAFRSRPDFRMVEIVGAPSIDVSQTTFPDKWRELPVYRWDTATAFRIEERLRGMGQQKPAGLNLARVLWLDEDGRGFTFRDKISGQQQQIWRLDAADGQDLGSVRSGGQGQLITRNPQNTAPGVEIRTRNLDLDATGRMPRAREISATGWRADADGLNVTLHLPPGWRLFALFGADWVKGDWLTAWTLLDLFLLLIFSLAVFRLWGVGAGLLAFLTFGLSYHEPGAPRYIWLVLLVPLALLRVVPAGWGRRLLEWGKWLAIAVFVLILVPFVARQIQQALYPQLEGLDRGADRSTLDFSGVSNDDPFPRAEVDSGRAGKLESKLERTIIPTVEFREATIPEAIEFLKKKSIELDPDDPKTGVNIVLKPNAGQNGVIDARVSVSLTNVPLMEALRYVCGLANMKLKVESSAVVITPTNLTSISTESPAAEMSFSLSIPGLEALPGAFPSGSTIAALSRPSSSRDNLKYAAEARIQTGPGVPEWTWRPVSFGWNGPVQAAQQVRPVLIPLGVERGLTLLRVLLLLALSAVLLNARRLGGSVFRPTGKIAAALLATLLTANAAQAQMPDAATLETLRQRLLQISDAYPTAADIPTVSLQLTERRVIIEAEIHTALRTAVPLPGRLPAWSPLTVLVDDQPEAALRREDGYLWIVLPAGVHRVHVEGTLADLTEWEWTFLLKPRQVKIDAPGWTFSGVRPDGVPEPQVFFALKQKAAAGQASYERQDLQSVAVIDRSLELGLVWQVRTTVTRLSPVGKAVALRVPLLPGENVLSSNATVRDGFIDVRLGAQEPSFTWESGLPVTPALPLATRAEDTWVERWHLVASPIWNVTLAGLAPTFEPGNPDLVPVWQPWPGESVALTISRPEAIAGATVTVSRATHRITLGRRQRVSQLELNLRCSLGEDFLIDLPAEAEITSLTHSGKAIPVRKDGARLIVPLRPGEQSVAVGWKVNTELQFHATAGEVRLPVESANVSTTITVPEDRWVLWAHGPTRGPAVRFWGILAISLLAALALGRAARSPLRTLEWMLLVIGLTQVPLPAAMIVVGWFFALAWRGDAAFLRLKNGTFNALQVFLILLTAGALGILLTAVGEGLLGSPEMFITGNGSYSTSLRWFQARADGLLPRAGCFSISIWWYRLLMLAWALWLAASLIRWLRVGWEHFSSGGCFRKTPKLIVPPPLPVKP